MKKLDYEIILEQIKQVMKFIMVMTLLRVEDVKEDDDEYASTLDMLFNRQEIWE